MVRQHQGMIRANRLPIHAVEDTSSISFWLGGAFEHLRGPAAPAGGGVIHQKTAAGELSLKQRGVFSSVLLFASCESESAASATLPLVLSPNNVSTTLK